MPRKDSRYSEVAVCKAWTEHPKAAASSGWELKPSMQERAKLCDDHREPQLRMRCSRHHWQLTHSTTASQPLQMHL